MKSNRKKRTRPKKSVYYSRLPSEQLDAIAAPFDREFVPTEPLTPAMRAKERRAKQKIGRPIIGEGAQKVLVCLERGLLRAVDTQARRHNQNRSQFIAEALRAQMKQRPARAAS